MLIRICLNKAFLRCCLYSAPSNSANTWNLQDIVELLKFIRRKLFEYSAVCSYIAGDINLSSTHWPSMTSTSLFEQTILSELCESNFQQLIKTQDGRSLDVLLCSKPQYVTSIVIDNHLRSLFNSDHKPHQAKVSFDIRPVHISSPSPNKKLDFGIPAYKKANWKEIIEFILQHPFQLYCMSNVDLMVELWYKWLHEILEDLLPITTKNRSELAPWVSGNSSNLIKKLNTLQLKQQRQPTPSNKIKIECLQTELTLSLQNYQHLREMTLFKEGKIQRHTEILEVDHQVEHYPYRIFFGSKNCQYRY